MTFVPGTRKRVLSTWKPARTKERASERANDSESDIIFDEAHDAPVVGKEPRKEPFLEVSRQDMDLLGATVSEPFERAGPLVSPLPSGARRRLARKAASRGP